MTSSGVVIFPLGDKVVNVRNGHETDNKQQNNMNKARRQGLVRLEIEDQMTRRNSLAQRKLALKIDDIEKKQALALKAMKHQKMEFIQQVRSGPSVARHRQRSDAGGLFFPPVDQRLRVQGRTFNGGKAWNVAVSSAIRRDVRASNTDKLLSQSRLTNLQRTGRCTLDDLARSNDSLSSARRKSAVCVKTE